jgi:hypothetical protein
MRFLSRSGVPLALRVLESRCLTEEMGGRKLRDDVAINLTASYKEEGRELRNKLLLFRFRNFGRRTVDPALVDRSIEPRLAQVFVPLLSVIEDAGAREELRKVARECHKELVADRGMDIEAQVLEIIRELAGVFLWTGAFDQRDRQAVYRRAR